MKIRITRLGGIVYVSISGPQDFVNFATSTIREVNFGKRIYPRMEKLGYCDKRECLIYRNMIQIEE